MDIVLLTFHLCASLALTSGQLQWTQVHDGSGTAPSARSHSAIGYDSTNTRLVIFGGGSSLSDTWEFTIGTATWNQLSPATSPSGRFSMVYGSSGTYFYIATGEDSSATFFNDIWRFDFTTNQWTQLPTSTSPAKRYGAGGGIFSGANNFYVSLGFAAERYFDTWSYDVTQQTSWNRRFCHDGMNCAPYNPTYPHARCLHAATMVGNDELVLFGGCLSGGKTGGPCPAHDTWLFNGEKMEWKRMNGCPSASVYGAMAPLPVSNGLRRVVLYGGNEKYKNQVFKTVESSAGEVAVLDPDGNSWTIREVSGTAPTKRNGAVMITAGTTGIYMFGGAANSGGNSMNDLWFLQGNSEDADKSPSKDCPGVGSFINSIQLHGAFMFIGWGVCLTWGAFVARYLKSDGKIWFWTHIGLQMSGYGFAFLGFIFAIVSVQFNHMQFAHGIIGLVIMIVAIAQPINGFLRPHKPPGDEPKPMKRYIWEKAHHFIGRVTILLALINISLGVFVAVSSTVVWALWFAYLCIVFIAFVGPQIFLYFKKDIQQTGKVSNCDCLPVGRESNGDRNSKEMVIKAGENDAAGQ